MKAPLFEFTFAYKKTSMGYIGFVEEVPGAGSQGATMEELKDNLKDAIRAIFAANKLESKNERLFDDDYKTSALQ